MDFDQVYRAFFRDVLFYVWGLCGDRVLAEEIAQETFFKALKSIDRFDGQGDIRPWLFAISKNTYYDHCRKQKKTEPLEEGTGGGTVVSGENDRRGNGFCGTCVFA